MRIDIITIFPDYFAPLSVSLLGKAASRGDIELQVHDLRNWAHGVHRAVDDAPFGGGPGMVMSPEPWGEALDAVADSGPPSARLVVPTPSGHTFTPRSLTMLSPRPANLLMRRSQLPHEHCSRGYREARSMMLYRNWALPVL